MSSSQGVGSLGCLLLVSDPDSLPQLSFSAAVHLSSDFLICLGVPCSRSPLLFHPLFFFQPLHLPLHSPSHFISLALSRFSCVPSAYSKVLNKQTSSGWLESPIYNSSQSKYNKDVCQTHEVRVSASHRETRGEERGCMS